MNTLTRIILAPTSASRSWILKKLTKSPTSSGKGRKTRNWSTECSETGLPFKEKQGLGDEEAASTVKLSAEAATGTAGK